MRRTSGEHAARHIRSLIFEGELEPGTRIPQDEIAQELGISRIPLREALIALEREGWVTLEMHRGAYVSAIDEASLLDHYAMFGTVYGFATRRALDRSKPGLYEALAAIRDELAAEPDPAAAGMLLRRFHQTIVAAARSPRTEVLLRAIPSLIPGDIFTTLPHVVDIERDAVDRIVKAVGDGDGDAAAAAYEEMLVRAGQEVAELFRQRNLFGPAVAVENS